MKLEGSLDAFSVPDIFRLLAFTQKTGALQLTSSGGHGVVYLTAGSITGAADSTHLDVGRRLVAEVDLDEAELEAVVEAALGAGSLAKALIATGKVDRAVVERSVSDHVADVVGELLRWSEGSFVFAVDQPNPDDVEVSLGVDDVVARAQECLESWTALGSRAPSQDAVLALALSVGADAAVSLDEWKVLAHVDGQRSVRDIVRLTEWGEYRVAEALTGLVERGLLVNREQRDAELLVLERRQRLLQRLDGNTHDNTAPAEEPTTPEPIVEIADVEQASETEPEPAPELEPELEPEPEPEPEPSEDSIPVPVQREESSTDGDTSVNKSLLLRLIAGVQGL